ncbi:murein biosynthesis integral membrane protein MurJ [Francisella frigiditurris]|uniref:Probable lipid II flippase MurJ n=1 Tax=Francisella frigiditurris TaxID=1542390 RepID=A0A1J0KUV8_9GAMM|nr:murein biosynthesis integral membrane protein MurJ [Francisella frigiditurris]APC97475.1 murein biosynthesis integral membrane protein MurJ [Francisella frigiditurris]
MKKFFSNSLIVSFFLLLSKILGFVRDILLASFFGTGIAMQAFLIAFRIPEFMRKVASSGAITQILNPYIKGRVSNQQKQFVATILFFVSISLLFIILLGIAFSNLWVSIFATGIMDDYQIFKLCSTLFIIMIPYVLFIFLVALISAILNSHKRYVIASIIPLILNISMIMGVLIAPKFNTPIYVVAYSVLIAGIFQLIVAMISLYKLVGKIDISKSVIFMRDLRVIVFFRKFPAAFVGASILSINSLVETFFASFLISGSLAWLYYADRVNQFVYGVFGTAIATVVIPYLIQYRNDYSNFRYVFSRVFNFAIYITVPALVGLVILSKPIVVTLFNYGKFSEQDVNFTQMALMGYAVSLFCFVVIRIITSALYISSQTNIVFRISVFCLLVNIVLDALVIYFLSDDTYAFFILAIITSLVALLNLMMQMIILAKFNFTIFINLFFSKSYFLKIFISIGVMILVLFSFDLNIDVWFQMTLLERFLRLFLIISLSAMSYIVITLLLGVKKYLIIKH